MNMKISTLYSQYICNKEYKNQNIPKFGHHPDLELMLNERNSPVMVSRWFRRGYECFKPGEYFPDVVKVFNNIFKETEKQIKMLIVGVANSEEPFSYLSVIKQIIKNKKIEDSVDLHIIDLQSKPDRCKLYKDSYYTMDEIPNYAKESFIYDQCTKMSSFNYRIKDELFEFLYNTYNDTSKSKWETRAQEAIKKYPSNYFDIISINNVACYMKAADLQITGDNIYRTLIPNGYIIEESGIYAQTCKDADKFKHIDLGINRKIK